MKILIIGGTGTMGAPLTDLLDSLNEDVSIVCRNKTKEKKNVKYFYGNAKDEVFMQAVLSTGHYDSIIDFCLYNSKEFSQKYELLLHHTNQYICLSSIQVVADSDLPKTEESPRYMETDPPMKGEKYYWYCYEKARIEDTLIKSGYQNWTIIRPSITMNEDHYFWGDFIDELWTYRILRGGTVPIPKNMLNVKTSITYGGDVAQMLLSIIGNPTALGQIYNVTSNVFTWGQLLELYKSIFGKMGFQIKIKYLDNAKPLMINSGYKYLYERTRTNNRVFDSSKVYRLMEQKKIKREFASFENKLEEWVRRDLSRLPKSIERSQIMQVALLDKICNEFTNRSAMGGAKHYSIYLCYRIAPTLTCFFSQICRYVRAIDRRIRCKQ